MSLYNSVAMADISDITRPKSPGKMVDTRVVHAPVEPRPDYDRMRRTVYGIPERDKGLSLNEQSTEEQKG